MMSYEDTLAYLYASTPAFHQVGAGAYKPGLGNTLRLMEHLGHPERQFKSVHVAGTNGKGSTSHMLAAVLQCAGYKAGLYTSPHLVDYRERIRINGQMIEKSEVVHFVDENRSLLEDVRPSFFETTMALAFRYFAAQKVDIAVVEVGLGGRLDSTNIIVPEVSVITNIGLDHTEFLGNTLQEIAAEKAGIIKTGVPVVIGERDADTAPVFIAASETCNAPIVFASDNISPIPACQLKGAYQTANIRTVLAAVEQLRKKGWMISEEAVRTGLAQVCSLTGLRGRWETLQQNPLVICDTGHNSHGVRSYIEDLQRLQGLHIVFGMVADKDVEVVLGMLPKEAKYYWTQAQTKRAIPAEEMLCLGEKYNLHGRAFQTVQDAFDAAIKNSVAADTIFIGGSNYVAGEVLGLLKVEQ